MVARLQLWLTMSLAALAFGLPVRADVKPYVDLELVLAVDVSLSMDHDEQRLQRDGYVAALRDPQVIKAIQSGPNGSIALAYVEWAGRISQSVVIPWRVIKDTADANAFAVTLAAKPISRALMTSVSEAVHTSHNLFASSPVQGLRRVIDISGDGPNNDGGPVADARDHAVADGVIINGLAIQLADRRGPYTYFDLPDLDRYYKDCVIGGPGAFVLPITHSREFATAIRQKLLLEIAAVEPVSRPKVHRVQLAEQAAKYDCLIGEKMWRQYQRDRGSEW